MRIALDPFMHRHLPLDELPHEVKQLGFDWIELSPRSDFLEWFKAPRVFPDRVKQFKKALAEASVNEVSFPRHGVQCRYCLETEFLFSRLPSRAIV